MAICMSAIAPVLYTTKAESFSYNKSNMNSEINKKNYFNCKVNWNNIYLWRGFLENATIKLD